MAAPENDARLEGDDVVETEADSVDVVAHEVALLLRRVDAARHTAAMLDRSAYLLLGELEAQGPLGIAVLANSFQVDLSTASRQAATLETKGLVQRLPNPDDGRVSLLQITPLGRSLFQATRNARHALYAEILEGWSEEDRSRFGAYLTRFNEAIVQRRRRRIEAPAARKP